MEEGRYGRVDGHEQEPEHDTAKDRNDVVLCPGIRDEGGLAEDGDERARVHGGAPDPVARGLAVVLRQV